MKNRNRLFCILAIVILCLSVSFLYIQNKNLKKQEAYKVFHILEWTLVQSQQNVDALFTSEEIDSVQALTARFLSDFEPINKLVRDQNDDVKFVVTKAGSDEEVKSAIDRIIDRNERLEKAHSNMYERFDLTESGIDAFRLELLEALNDKNHPIQQFFYNELSN